LLAQGSLTPPGAPAPTMKSLDQIEPRTPVDAVHTPAAGFGEFAITNPGSYYLTTNIIGVTSKYGIEIMTNHVTLDLNGFALLGGGDGAAGIYISSSANDVTVRNGMISGWGDGADSAAPDTVLEHLKIVGCTGSAIYNFSAPTVVRDCLCESDGGDLTYPTIVSMGGEISGCIVMNNGGIGLDLHKGYGIVSDCLVASNGLYGISISTPGWQVLGNNCVSNAAIAILINSGNNQIEGNHIVTRSGVAGIEVTGSGYSNNVVIKNIVSGNGANNYLNPGNNDFGPIGTAASSTNPWANISH
jgi:parallel beta-helix repeat protein